MPGSLPPITPRHRSLRVARYLLLVGLIGLVGNRLVAQTPPDASLRKAFANPPDDSRIMMRWWWFGPAVTKPEIQRELEQMKADGIGGVEIANLYPQALDDPPSPDKSRSLDNLETGFHNQPYLSDEHIEMLRFAASKARELGLRVDITLGSGWPFGGPHIPVTQAAGLLRVETVDVPADADSIAVPPISAGEKLLAAFLAGGDTNKPSLADANEISKLTIEDGRLTLPSDLKANRTMIFFISSRTGMMVKRPSVDAAGFVLDHYDRNATETHLKAVGDRLLQAFGDRPPYAVFSDSLEDYGSNWTGDMLGEFQKRRGYDLTPYLPALIGDIGPKTAAVRHDWGQTLTELVDEGFLMTLHSWAREHRTLLRSQTYGYPPVTLSSNQYEDLPEGEGKSDLMMWRHFSDLRWASSASHLFGHQVTSSETWTWLHSPAFRATPLDMKAEADLHFLDGINQLIGHGWPYSPASEAEPGWRMYAAGAFNDHNPWSFVMPDVTRYLQRVSYALRQGQPANDIALLLPNDDAWATFHSSPHSSAAVTTTLGFNTAGTVFSIDDAMDDLLGQTIIPQILDSGFNLDFMDADAIDKLGVNYPVLVLPGLERIPVATYRRIEEYANRGGIVIATRKLPSLAPGLRNAESETAEIHLISNRLFEKPAAKGHFVEDETTLGTLLASLRKPDVRLTDPTPEIGFIHRRLSNADLYFIANTSNRAHSVRAAFRTQRRSAEIWDPMTGRISPATNAASVELSLQPYESKLVYLSDDLPYTPIVAAPKVGHHDVDIPLASDWTLTFDRLKRTVSLPTLRSWSDDPALRYFSGLVTYRKRFDISSADLQSGRPLFLDLGPGTTIDTPSPLGNHSMRAYLESPVREAAEVYINDRSAGYIWHPPYSVRIDTLLHPGTNDVKILVGNTAINELAGRRQPDYRLLRARYGDLFSPQDMENLTPLPSGILTTLNITSTPR